MNLCSGKHTPKRPINRNLLLVLLASTMALAVVTQVAAGPATGYAWITNTNEGTISKVNTTTGGEEARYFTGPLLSAYPVPSTVDLDYYSDVGVGRGLDPSRTAFDKDGNCYVLNIAFPRPHAGAGQVNGVPTVIRILADNAGLSNTSRDNIAPYGSIEGNEMKPWGQDQAVRQIPWEGPQGGGGRGLIIDKAGYVWVGIFDMYDPNDRGCLDYNGKYAGPGHVYKIDPTSGEVMAELKTHSVYGMALAPNGTIYLISRSCGTLQEINPGNSFCGDSGPARVSRQWVIGSEIPGLLGYRPYSVAVDWQGIVWMNAFQEAGTSPDDSIRTWHLVRFDPHSTSFQEIAIPNTKTDKLWRMNRGNVTIDKSGFIWVPLAYTDSIAKFRSSPLSLVSMFNLDVAPGFDPIGSGVADDGNILVLMKNGQDNLPGNWIKISRTSGTVLTARTLPTLYSNIGCNIYSRGEITGVGVEMRNNPPVCIVADQRVNAGSDCTAFASIDNGSYDPDCDRFTIAQSPSGPYAKGTTTVTLTITDQFGLSSQCQATVTVRDVTPPDVHCPGDMTVDNQPGQCGAVVAFAATVGDNCPGASVNCNPSSGSFFPVGSSTVTCTGRDASGNTSTCTFRITVQDTEPPSITCPQDIVLATAAGQCGRTVIFAPTASDNCGVTQLSSSPVSGSFFPVGTTTVTSTARDAAGNTSSCTFRITITNSAPTLAVPADDSVFQCVATQVCLPYTASDPDNNLSSVTIVSGPGALNGGQWCYTPDQDRVVNVTIRAIDVCGSFVDKGFRIVFDINTAPALTVPQNDSVFQCVPTEVCLPYVATDEDGNYRHTVIISGPGEIRGSSWCFTPPKDTVVNVTLEASDTCNYTTLRSFRIVFDINTAPVLEVPVVDSFFQCRPTEVCLPYTAADEDQNLTTVVIASGPGELRDGRWCYTPTADGIVAVTVRATDACGEIDEKTFTQRFDLNQFPVITCPANATIHWGDVYHGTASAQDPDLATYHGASIVYSLGGASHDNATIDPSTGAITWASTGKNVCVNPFEVIATDNCGDRDTCYFDVCVQNTPPVITCVEDQVVCFGNDLNVFVSATDLDNGPYGPLYYLVSGPTGVTVDANTGEVSWIDPVPGVWQVCVTATDSAAICSPCSPNNADTCCFAVTVRTLDIVIEKVHDQVQGQYTDVSIDFLYHGNNWPIAGYDFLIQYDQSALSFQKAEEGLFYQDCGWEYFTYRFGSSGNCGGGTCPSGVLRVVAMAESNGGNPASHPDCYTNDGLPSPGPSSTTSAEMATLTFLVSNDRTLECQYVPVRFVWYDCADNALSNVRGDTLYISHFVYDYAGDAGDPQSAEWSEITGLDNTFPTPTGAPSPQCDISDKFELVRCASFYNGGIDIICADSIDAPGDINLNGISNEIADAVMFTNYFLEGVAAFSGHVDGSVAASDVNKDGITLSVSDLVYLIRIVVGDAQPYAKGQPPLGCYSHEAGVLAISGGVSVSVVAMVVEGNVQPELLVGGANLGYRFNGEVTRLIVSPDLETHSLNSFTGPILRGITGKVLSIQLASPDGVELSAMNVPENYSLRQNYPNPFNPVTTIEFGLPRPGQYRLTIYNIEGRLVEQHVGEAEVAGYYHFNWDASRLASGVYLYRLTASDFVDTKKMLLLK